jgi:hypothetical protein
MDKPVSLTTFVDFVSKAGTPKATVVRNWKEKDEYQVASDFYKQLREAIIEYHKVRTPLDAVLRYCHRKKVVHYQAAITGYKKWIRGKSLKLFKSSVGRWQSGRLLVSINPELGLTINGVPHLMKLYFKADGLTKNRIGIITHLMAATLADEAPEHCVMAVLDVRNAKLFPGSGVDPLLETQLQAEAAYWNVMWPAI